MDKTILIEYYKIIMELPFPPLLKIGLLNLFCAWIVSSEKEYAKLIQYIQEYLDRFLIEHDQWTEKDAKQRDDLKESFERFLKDGNLN